MQLGEVTLRSEREGESAVRSRIRLWLDADSAARTVNAPVDPPADPSPGLGTGLPVPHARAATVMEAARALVTGSRADRRRVRVLLACVVAAERPAWFAELCLLADALVVGEHPSADRWSPEERRLVVGWVAVLLELSGEAGVERLVDALVRRGSDAGNDRRNPG
ncbi:hypothetical protein AB0D49_39340 [Streptomyces sp. NPDC048290]|uniref:hypothetical protein n=1 Tax=Streptomyces sp. NPDC048290 TaxID=3155811 RepID=UPI003449CF85